jgi:hypothetical protein
MLRTPRNDTTCVPLCFSHACAKRADACEKCTASTVARGSASRLDRVTAHGWGTLGGRVDAGHGHLGRAPWPTTTVHPDRLLG